MADSRSHQMMAILRGDRFDSGSTPSAAPSSRAAEIQRAMRTDEDHAEIHEANATGRAQHEQAVRALTAKLRRDGVPYPEAAARRQLNAELLSANREKYSQSVTKAMHSANDPEQRRDEWATRADKPVRAPQAGDPYITADGGGVGYRRDRVGERLMAQFYGARTR
ncbi:hypothetical protein NC315_13550 [Streptomyces sp. G2]|uniref:hypothetical protein n=1 Tax=Streptomyces sp. G2 TaxID=1684471 RepID=UPI0020304618|nr:hypothetical protein [Streptomyces sp. G2]MCM1946395.1 hypothetical protein [Streptomyces sp. G2]